MKYPSSYLSSLTPLLIAFIANTVPLQGTTYYFGQASQSSGQHWNYTSIWWENPDFTGSHPASVTAADDFVGLQNTLRTNQGSGTSTFNGNSLSMEGGSLLMKSRYVVVNTLITGGNSISNGENDSGGAQRYIIDLNVTDWAIAGTTTLVCGSSARTINANATTLSGEGQLLLSGTGGDDPFNLNFTTATEYTGEITLSNGILSFGNDLLSGGSLTLNSGTTTVLDQDVTFAGVTIGATVLDPGTYSFATLESSYGAYFQDGGSGSITVVPEPQTYALLLSAGLLILAWYRRR